MKYHRLSLNPGCTRGTGRHCRVPQNFCASTSSKAAFSKLEIDYASLPTLSNLEFPGYTPLVFRPFISYNASKKAQVDA